MSRLRATLSPTEADREIQTALNRAARQIEAALQTVTSVQLARHQKRKTVGDLRQALDLVQKVRYLGKQESVGETHDDWRARQDQRDQVRLERRAMRDQADG